MGSKHANKNNSRENGTDKGGNGMVIARRSIELLVDTIGEILAFLAAFLILFMCLNGFVQLLPENFVKPMSLLREVIVVLLVLSKGMEFCLKKGWILTAVFGAVCLAIIILMWFPGALPEWVPPWIVTGN